MGLIDTEESPTRRVALIRIYGTGKDEDYIITGRECTPPQQDEQYAIYLGRGKILKTSPVQSIMSYQGSLFIKTAGSLYQLEYLMLEP